MNRLAWIAVVALVGIVSFVVGDLLDPDAVPVARAVVLTGTAPADGPPPEGFLVVPPRIVDFRDDADDQIQNGQDRGDLDDPDPDESPDNSPDDPDDEDDSVDDDD